MFLGYLRRHHVGLLALFLALGGTSYAAVKLPRNSVGTAQIKSHAVTTSKLSTATVKALKGAKGDPGATGPAGANGAKGDPGAPATFSAGVSGLSVSSGPATGNDVLQPVTVTLKSAGSVLVVATMGINGTCGGGGCTFQLGAAVDGVPVTGASISASAGAGSPFTKATVTLAGMAQNLPAGTHIVQLRSLADANVAASTVSTDSRVVAFAIG
jgi:hypothetical protein